MQEGRNENNCDEGYVHAKFPLESNVGLASEVWANLLRGVWEPKKKETFKKGHYEQESRTESVAREFSYSKTRWSANKKW